MQVWSNDYNPASKETEVVDKIKELVNENHDFRTVQKVGGTEKLRSFMNKLYPRCTQKEIEKLLSVPDSTLQRWLAKLNIRTYRYQNVEVFARIGDENKENFVKVGNKIKKIVTIKLTPELAYVIGFTLGDGAVQKYMVEVFNKDEDLREHLLEYLNPYGTITQDRRENGLWRLRLSSVSLAKIIKENKKIRKDTLNRIFRNKKLARKFIAAFWDAEGSVRKGTNRNYFYIYLYNCNKYLLNKIGHFIKSRGIKFSKLLMDRRKRSYSLNGRPVVSRKVLHRISIPKSHGLRWAKEIGIHMLHSKKRKVVNEILKIYKGGING